MSLQKGLKAKLSSALKWQLAIRTLLHICMNGLLSPLHGIFLRNSKLILHTMWFKFQIWDHGITNAIHTHCCCWAWPVTALAQPNQQQLQEKPFYIQTCSLLNMDHWESMWIPVWHCVVLGGGEFQLSEHQWALGDHLTSVPAAALSLLLSEVESHSTKHKKKNSHQQDHILKTLFLQR